MLAHRDALNAMGHDEEACDVDAQRCCKNAMLRKERSETRAGQELGARAVFCPNWASSGRNAQVWPNWHTFGPLFSQIWPGIGKHRPGIDQDQSVVGQHWSAFGPSSHNRQIFWSGVGQLLTTFQQDWPDFKQILPNPAQGSDHSRHAEPATFQKSELEAVMLVRVRVLSASF